MTNENEAKKLKSSGFSLFLFFRTINRHRHEHGQNRNKHHKHTHTHTHILWVSVDRPHVRPVVTVENKQEKRWEKRKEETLFKPMPINNFFPLYCASLILYLFFFFFFCICWSYFKFRKEKESQKQNKILSFLLGLSHAKRLQNFESEKIRLKWNKEKGLVVGWAVRSEEAAARRSR